jgi:hypothetical protein
LVVCPLSPSPQHPPDRASFLTGRHVLVLAIIAIIANIANIANMATSGIFKYFSYWWLPVFSGFVWLGTLLGMLLFWIVGTDSERYPAIDANMSLAYISDIGAYEMKPLFIAGSAVTTVTFDLAFLAERFLRHRGRLVPNQSTGEKVLMGLSIFCALVGTAGLILLSVFDTVRYSTVHNICLCLFIGGYLFSAVFICWEYQRLGIKNRAYRVLRASFWIKLAFILLEFFLVIAFGVLTSTGHKNIAAYFEWIIAFIFTAYVWSFAIDLWPAVNTKSYSQRFTKPSPREMEEQDSSTGSLPTA